MMNKNTFAANILAALPSAMLGAVCALALCIPLRMGTVAFAAQPDTRTNPDDSDIMTLAYLPGPEEGDIVELPDVQTAVPLADGPSARTACGVAGVETPDGSYTAVSQTSDETGSTVVTSDTATVVIDEFNVAVYRNDGAIFVYETDECTIL